MNTKVSMIDPSNLPPELTEPPPDAPGWLAFQPATAKVWQKLDGTWLPISEAQERIRNRTPSLTALSSYSTGTVSVAANGTVVTGAGVIWSDINALPGDVFQIADFQTIISDKTDTSHLVIPPWGGGAQTNVAYTIWKVSPQRFAGAQAMQFVNDLVAKLDSSGLLWYLPEGYTDPNDVVPAMTADDGQGILKIDTGALWVMQGGAWVPAGTYKGFQYKGAYNPATSYVINDVLTSAGNAYIVTAPTTGHAPPNAAYYDLLASKGDTGATGATGATGPGYGGTSTTSLSIGTGAKAFTTQAGLAYQNGARVRATATAGGPGWLEGVVTYSGTTLTITADKFSGSGTGTAWNFNVAGEPGAGDLSSANNLADLANKDTALTNLGGTTTGKAVFKSASADAALDTLSVVDRVIDQGNIPQTANFDIALPSGYDEIEIGLFGFGCSVSGAGLNLQVSTDGTTFLSSSYSYAGHYITTADTTYHGYSAAGTGSNIPLSNLFPAGRLAQLKIRLARPDGTSGNKLIRANMDQVGTDLQPVQLNVMGGYLGGTAALQKLRLVWNGGTSPAFAAGGTYIVRGVKKKP
ncbi:MULTISPECIES: hypothetical protein [Bradyrhizobium]|uniref:hypothetical protein n=1 Tax=Bradyrhizobium TaxID=374 RepID=UPI0004AED518|nr:MULTISPECIES: hypothetical protein [Bradyrhizobium]MCS3449564.1 hypothetical protein [Bradyrhizobium elkanii]MCS3559293.1 hypothetical protein [Bradyrhizobium elkanii]MCW2150861.1 hypothetical protein [Bradyrhizobium elkanii]MCW2359096.1 hypothetical protein [Bradyrhizobium elkanii]MCW2374592.1 hypothetical protein [Bradyrhizobium elkanii]